MRGILYEFTLHNSPKISKAWESYPNFHLAQTILVRLVELKRIHFKVLQAKILDLEGPKILEFHQKDRPQIKFQSNVT